MSAYRPEDHHTSTSDGAAAFERDHGDETYDRPSMAEVVDADGWSPGWPYYEARDWNVGLGWST